MPVGSEAARSGQGSLHDISTLLIIDSEPVFAGGLARFLEAEGLGFQVLGTATLSPDTEEMVLKTQPDLVILDARFGLEAGHRLRMMSPHTRVVLVSRMEEAVDIQEALKAEIQGCFLREGEPDEIVDVLRLILRDHIVLHASLTRDSLASGPGRATLTETEKAILAGIARGQTNRQIGNRLHLSERTIRRRVVRIYSKLGVADRIEAALYVGRAGLFGAESPGSDSLDAHLHQPSKGRHGVPLMS